MGGSAECPDTLENLGRVLLLVQVDGEEGIVLMKVQGRGLAGAEEYGDVLHLDEGHGRRLEADAGRRYGEVNEPAGGGPSASSHESPPWFRMLVRSDGRGKGRRGGRGEDILAQSNSILEAFEQVSRREPLAQDFFDPVPDLVGCCGRELLQAHPAQVFIQGCDRRHYSYLLLS